MLGCLGIQLPSLQLYFVVILRGFVIALSGYASCVPKLSDIVLSYECSNLNGHCFSTTESVPVKS